VKDAMLHGEMGFAKGNVDYDGRRCAAFQEAAAHYQDIPLPDELADKDSDAKTAITDL
jgi:hypothetical protein